MPIEKRPTLERWTEIMEKSSPTDALNLRELAIAQLDFDSMWNEHVNIAEAILKKRHIDWEPNSAE